ncbi:MAG: hotdog fold thioesterase [Phycisphaerae bacterium]|nr:hotdog fold thioesterase [Gemmatimonadaceae bacterium]
MTTPRESEAQHNSEKRSAEAELASAIVEKMMPVDSFSRWLGIETVEVAPGRSVVRMTVRGDMLNGMGGVHGGVVYSLADSAFSYATNNTGVVSVAIDCTVNYPAAVQVGDVLTASATVESSSRRLAFCAVLVRNQHAVTVGHFRGTVYRTHKLHFPVDAAPEPTPTS